MTWTGLAARGQVVARATTDRAALRELLEQDRLFAAYALCDLDEREFARTRWGMATDDTGHALAVAMEYSGPTPQPMFVMGRQDGIAAILRDVIRPRAAYVAGTEASLDAVSLHYHVDPGPRMIRMAVDRATFVPSLGAPVTRILPIEVGELNRLYQLGFAAWIPPAAITEGVYYGVRIHGRLVAAAGTHVISRDARLAVVGNVLTHSDHRGHGYAKAVTSAVTAELLRFCDEVVLNVRADNPPAIAAYARLGYREHCRFEERLARRSSPAWPDFTAPFRRLFSGRRTTPTPQAPHAGVNQAHPMYPNPAPDAPPALGPTEESS